MTRKSKREIERAIEELDDEDDDDRPMVLIAYRCSEGWLDGDGEPVPEDAEIQIGFSGVTIEREVAEREGYEILGSADTPAGDYVTVPWDYDDAEVSL